MHSSPASTKSIVTRNSLREDLGRIARTRKTGDATSLLAPALQALEALHQFRKERGISS